MYHSVAVATFHTQIVSGRRGGRTTTHSSCCNQLCVSLLRNVNHKVEKPNKLNRAPRSYYHNNHDIVDDMVAYKRGKVLIN